MDKALAGIPGTFLCADDIKVQGSSEERHDINLLEAVSKACPAGIKFNPEKCHIKKTEDWVLLTDGVLRRCRTMPQEGESHLQVATSDQQAGATELSRNDELHVHIHTTPVTEDTHDAQPPEERCALRMD